MVWISNGDTGLSVRTKLNTIPNDGASYTASATTALSSLPWYPPAVAGSLDDEFLAGSLDTGRWTWVNQSTRTATLTNSNCTLTFPTAGATDNWGHIVQTAPGTPWTVVSKIGWAGTTSSNFTYGAIIARESSTGKFLNFGFDNVGIASNYWTNNTTYSAGIQSYAYGTWPGPSRGEYGYFKLQDNGTNIILSFSQTGITYTQVASVSRTAFMASGPNQVGLGIGANIASGTANIDVDFFRRTQ